MFRLLDHNTPDQEPAEAEQKRKPRTPKAPKQELPSPYPVWLDMPVVVEGKKWVPGRGPIPARFMVVGERPLEYEARSGTVFSGSMGNYLQGRFSANGFHATDIYYTNAIKYPLARNKNVSAKDVKACKPILLEELRRVKPEVVICLGSHALKAVLGKDANISVIRGEFIDHPEHPGMKVFAMHSPAYIQHNQEMEEWLNRDILTLASYWRGESKTKKVPNITYLRSPADVRCFTACLFQIIEHPLLVIDMEWHGKTWMDPQRYVRTCQIGFAPNEVAIVMFHHAGGALACTDEPATWAALKELLENPNVGIVGHNAIADGEWLMSYGIDIRPRVVWDTMLAEYLLRETGPWDLGEVAIKYTDYGRYSMDVESWVKANRGLCVHGYGHVPAHLLHPYGAIDVDAPRTVMEKQLPLLINEGFMNPRGVNGEYPSLWSTTLRTQELLYEVERNGLLVDCTRLNELIDAYQAKVKELISIIGQLAGAVGFHNFNPASPDDVRKMLFQVLQLPPVKTTNGRAWTDEVGNQGMDDDTEFKASTDKTTLEILQDAHPLVKYILQYRRIHQVCKTWLRAKEDGEDEASRGGGIPAKLWPDGRLHAHFSQLAETGRFRTSKPNVQNWPKKAEGSMAEIFGGKDKMPAGLRTIIVPAPGHVLLEGDFCQAELFVLAALSGDQNMWAALSTPGRDLHDLTAITAFRLRVLDPGGREVPESELIELAKANLAEGGAESKAFKEFVKTLTYVDQKGKRMTRDEFKETIRVSAKNLNFGSYW